MEEISNLNGITKGQLKQVNAVRLYLRVITIADLTEETGTFVPAGILTGNWQAGTNLEWPRQNKPPPRAWNTFRKCVKAAFCSRTPPYQRAHHSMDLDQPLGRWHHVERNTWWPCYMTKSEIYRRIEMEDDERGGDDEEENFEVFTTKPGSPGFYYGNGIKNTLPLESHPIKCQNIGPQSVWTHRQLRLRKIVSLNPPQAMTWIRDSQREVVERWSQGAMAWYIFERN